jgi:hypothetical protein
VQPEADERELAAIIALHTNIGAEFCGKVRSGTLDALEHRLRRFPLDDVESLCSHMLMIGTVRSAGGTAVFRASATSLRGLYFVVLDSQ